MNSNIGQQLKSEAINQFSAFVLGDRVWNDVKQFVKDIDGETKLTGQEKKDKVKADLKIVFGDLAEFILDTAVQLGVLYLRSLV